MPKKQKKRYANKRNKKLRKFRRVVFLLLFLTVCVISFCLFTPIFHIQNIAVKGNEQVEDEQIRQSSGIITQTNIFKVNKKKVQSGLSIIPYIKEVKISRKLPSTVVLNVTETHPALCFPFMTGYVLTDYEGKVLEHLAEPHEELPLVFGVEIEKAEISQKIAVQDTIKFDIILNCIGDLAKRDLIADVVQLHFEDISSFALYLESGLKVIFGKISDMDYKISVLSSIMPQINATQGTYVDLTMPSKAFYGREENKTPEPSPSPIDNIAPTEGVETGE